MKNGGKYTKKTKYRFKLLILSKKMEGKEQN